MSQTQRIKEGESFTVTIGFLKDDVALDSDFVLGYSVKILSSGPGM